MCINLALLFCNNYKCFCFTYNYLAGRTKKKKVYLLSTQHRPVPLQHYLFYDDDMYPLLVENKFNENAISDATKRSKEKAAV